MQHNGINCHRGLKVHADKCKIMLIEKSYLSNHDYSEYYLNSIIPIISFNFFVYSTKENNLGMTPDTNNFGENRNYAIICISHCV